MLLSFWIIFHSFKFNCNLVWYWNQWQYFSTKGKSSLNRRVETLTPMDGEVLWLTPCTVSIMMMRNSPWFSESSPARVRNSPWFSRKFPCYGFKPPPRPPGLLTLSVSLEPHVGHQMLEIASEMTQKQDTQETDTAPAGGKRTVQASKLAVYFYIAPLGRIPVCMTKPSQYSTCA